MEADAHTRLRRAFEYFDRDGSGFLDFRELRNALTLFGLDLHAEHAKQLLIAYDDRPDGKLDLTEFIKLVSDIKEVSFNIVRYFEIVNLILFKITYS